MLDIVEPADERAEIYENTHDSRGQSLTIKEHTNRPFVFFLHGIIEIYFIAFIVVHFDLVAFLFSRPNEQKIKSKQTKNQRYETIMKHHFLHENINEHRIQQNQNQEEQHSYSLHNPKR